MSRARFPDWTLHPVYSWANHWEARFGSGGVRAVSFPRGTKTANLVRFCTFVRVTYTLAASAGRSVRCRALLSLESQPERCSLLISK